MQHFFLNTVACSVYLWLHLGVNQQTDVDPFFDARKQKVLSFSLSHTHTQTHFCAHTHIHIHTHSGTDAMAASGGVLERTDMSQRRE